MGSKIKLPDFVLVTNEKNETQHAAQIREIFEKSLIDLGLKVSREQTALLNYVKIRAPKIIIRKYCEILKYRMPLKKFETKVLQDDSEPGNNFVKKIWNEVTNIYDFFVRGDLQHEKNKMFSLRALYSTDKHYLFDEDSPEFYSTTIRILVVNFILNRQNWSLDGSDPDCVGLGKLISDGVYFAAYPLHDGGYKESGCTRGQLYASWAQVKYWYKSQPVDEIKDYLGMTYGFYFAWLGFYTRLLIPATIFGCLVLVYGFFTLPSDYFSEELCHADNILMCPQCDKVCDYYKASDNCLYAKLTYLFDNLFTVIFAFLMAIWASTFLEMWKRYSAVLNHRWGLTQFSIEEEHPRPQFISKLSKYDHYKTNTITGKKERVVPTSVKVPAMVFSYVTILFFIMLVMIAVCGVVFYRMWLTAVLSSMKTDSWLKDYSSIVVSASAAGLNLISIMILNVIYSKVATYLTDLEIHRTQLEYDRALTVKIYLFQFINYYSSIMYIAFFKGKFIGFPGHYLRIFGYRQEECSYGGCLMELSIQLAFIMIGKQAFGAIIEMSIPAIKKKIMKQVAIMKHRKSMKKSESSRLIDINKQTRWFQDFKLLDIEDERGLFSEYLEMIIQFGFVTLFVPAFPIAPFCAWLNNIFEIRLDAQKMLKYYRRPIPYWAPNIGVWFQILEIVGNLAILTNAIVIAFSSNFIPKLVYMFNNNGNGTGFYYSTLSLFNVSDYDPEALPLETFITNITVCSYTDYREPFWSPERYTPTFMFWEVVIARLLFILIFQNVVVAVKSIIQYWIPDEPEELLELIKRENYLTTQLIIERETESLKKQRTLDLLNEDSTAANEDEDVSLSDSVEIGLKRLKSLSTNSVQQ